jgi:hypothetical protein
MPSTLKRFWSQVITPGTPFTLTLTPEYSLALSAAALGPRAEKDGSRTSLSYQAQGNGSPVELCTLVCCRADQCTFQADFDASDGKITLSAKGSDDVHVTGTLSFNDEPEEEADEEAGAGAQAQQQTATKKKRRHPDGAAAADPRAPAPGELGGHLYDVSSAPARRKYETQLLREPDPIAAYMRAIQLSRACADSPAALRRAETYLENALEFGAQVGETAEDMANMILLQSRLALMLLQEGGAEKDAMAQEALVDMGFTTRLSSEVVKYAAPANTPAVLTKKAKAGKAAKAEKGKGGLPDSDSTGGAGAVARVLDGALPAALLQHVQHGFGEPSVYWRDHQYDPETSGYFSYLHDMRKCTKQPANSVEQLIAHVHRLTAEQFPGVKKARYAEWWTHCRPHSSGHQLHFDSDDEGQNGPRHPIISTVLFVQADIGGPTLITTQRIGDHLSDQGWLAHPKENRLVMFDGRVLHGVIPGRGEVEAASTARRVTFMVAFWEDISAQPDLGGKPGASQRMPLPGERGHTWPGVMKLREGGWGSCAPVRVEPEPVAPVWKGVGKEVKSFQKLKRCPGYGECFQGF